MAKQSGHIKYTGTLGDVRHFKIKGLKGHYAPAEKNKIAEKANHGSSSILKGKIYESDIDEVVAEKMIGMLDLLG